jgi:GT2 family glycosyltransferase
MIEIVSATRKNEKSFWLHSPLGISLRRLTFDISLDCHIAYENKLSLGEIYNQRINSSHQDILVFIHDDVWIDDFYFGDHVLHGLEQYDVIGVAGNLRRVPYQPSWAMIEMIDDKFTWDEKKNLSGAIGYGESHFGPVSFFGKVPATCELLDGVFLSARRSKLKSSGVYFDPLFMFHFYDLDFCRTAIQNGLKLGTWHIAITHQSIGCSNFDEWKNMYANYLKKWMS